MIRVTTLGLITPYTKNIADLDDLMAHLHRIGYVQFSMEHGRVIAAAGVSMRSAGDETYILRQTLPDDVPREHRIEFLDHGDWLTTSVEFEDRCHAYGIRSEAE